MKTLSILLALGLVATTTVVGCGGSGTEWGGTETFDLTESDSDEPTLETEGGFWGDGYHEEDEGTDTNAP